MKLGLVTYRWAEDWDLPTILERCAETGFGGVELRSTHKHGVEPSLSPAERDDVRARFADSPVRLVGLGSACEYHSPDPAELKRNIDETRDFVVLCHDLGGEGVKVRPNGLPSGVPVEKTIEQIGRALNEVGRIGADYGVEIRVEVHGKGTSDVPTFAKFMDVANHPNVKTCWNCNAQDLEGAGLARNFALEAGRLGTIHIHDLISDYPWKELFALLRGAGFEGWTLLEEGNPTADPVRVMKYYRMLWERMVAEG